jgi:vacuolar-type H+-ATPase subunit H
LSDVIERLLDVEHEARRLIARAEHEAEQALERAREEGRRILAEGSDEAQRKTQEIVEGAQKALQQRMAERLKDEEKELPSAERIDPARLARAVETAVAVVSCGADPRRGNP